MFYSLTGNILFTDETSVAIECGGVGFRCFSTLNTLKRIGKTGSEVTLFTYLNVREDALDLYGFYDNREMECFKLLVGVTGVGPKAALSILSQLTPEKLALSIATADIKTITIAKGVGPKIAQRIILELKDKMKAENFGYEGFEDAESAGVASQAGSSGEAISALVSLGYSRSEASVTVSRLEEGLTTEEYIKQALKRLGRN
ncbi:MAG TPA: Holliday junction branch migration protein RuvA [Clostridia bacterium]|nr:Holliday junction branch migration protein RuvA [Clostridia bacterium]